MKLPSNRPYLVRAIYEWLTDHAQTPYLIVDAEYEDVHVPQHLVDDGRIVLNIGPTAVRDLDLANEAISFSARFNGRPTPVYVPIQAVTGLFSRENGHGMFFQPEAQVQEDNEPTPPPPQKKAPGAKPGKTGRPVLKVVK
ncbi:MAG: ClpXP protease specificity-enhancing factor [Pseudomonadota bacterium]